MKSTSSVLEKLKGKAHRLKKAKYDINTKIDGIVLKYYPRCTNKVQIANTSKQRHRLALINQKLVKLYKLKMKIQSKKKLEKVKEKTSLSVFKVKEVKTNSQSYNDKNSQCVLILSKQIMTYDDATLTSNKKNSSLFDDRSTKANTID